MWHWGIPNDASKRMEISMHVGSGYLLLRPRKDDLRTLSPHNECRSNQKHLDQSLALLKVLI